MPVQVVTVSVAFAELSFLRSCHEQQQLQNLTHPEFLQCFAYTWFFGMCFFWSFFRAAPAAYGGSQARGPVRAVAASLRQGRSNAGSKPRLRPTPQLTAMPDP